MRTPGFDPDLTQQFTAPFRRVINKDGSFNVHRRGGTWRDVHPYLHLINMSWPAFLFTLFAGYAAANTIFAAVYFTLEPGQLQGADASTAMGRFLNGFFFSPHTLTTVGYGNIAPKGLQSQIVSSVEALGGVLGLAVATGLLFGRVSRPSAKIGFSENVLVAPYQDGTSLQFRIVNRRRNNVMNLEARVMLMTVDMENSVPKRKFELLKLERPTVLFLALTWTLAHPIDSESPIFVKSAEDLRRMQAELLIMIQA